MVRLLLGMPDTAALKRININIDSLDAEETQQDNCNTSIDATKVANAKQEIHGAGKCCTHTDDIFKITNNNNGPTVNPNANMLTKFFLSCPNVETDKRKSAELTYQIHIEFDNVCNGIRCFEGTFSLHLKLNSRPFQAPPRCVAYVLQKLFKDKLDRLQQLDIITPQGLRKWQSGVTALC